MKLKENLKKYRTQAGYTLQEVADILGISRSTLFKYESGDIPNIPIENIIKLAEIYKTDPNKLIGWDLFCEYEPNNKNILTFDIPKLVQAYLKIKTLIEKSAEQKEKKYLIEQLEEIFYLNDIILDYMEKKGTIEINLQEIKLAKQLSYKSIIKQQELLNNFSKLNELGQNKILEDIADLTELPKYQKDPDN